MRDEPRPAPDFAPDRAVVQKFGGVALADGAGVRRACRLVAKRGGARPIVVVSAIGEVTALLDATAKEAARGAADSTRVRLRHKRLLAEADLEPGLLRALFSELEALLHGLAQRGACGPAERDHALSFGERMSARILAAALRSEGLAATPVDAWELGLQSDSNHGRARPLEGIARGIGRSLGAVSGVPVVTGFVAADAGGALTTLGRNGSDLTAALVAEAIGAGELQLWKAVDGVMTADPRWVPEARPLRELTYDRAAALFFHGAGVVHADALAPLERAGIPLRVLSLARPDDAGTRIHAGRAEGGVVGLALRVAPAPALTLVAAGWRDIPLAACELALRGAGVDPRAESADSERGTITWRVPEEQLGPAARALHAALWPAPQRSTDIDDCAPQATAASSP